jgi:hypothetical protein
MSEKRKRRRVRGATLTVVFTCPNCRLQTPALVTVPPQVPETENVVLTHDCQHCDGGLCAEAPAGRLRACDGGEYAP